MEPHLNGPASNEVKVAIESLCALRYSDRKSKFKKKWFDDRGGYESVAAIRKAPPPNMELSEWNQYCNYYMEEKNKKRSEVNTVNRGKQEYQSRHGSKSLVAHRHDKLSEKDGKYTLLDQYKEMHTRKGVWTHNTAKRRYDDMVNDTTSTALGEEDIITKNLGERRGFYPGIGKKLPGSSRVCGQRASGSKGNMYTKQEVHQVVSSVVGKMFGKLANHINENFAMVCDVLQNAKVDRPKLKDVDPRMFLVSDDEDEDEEEEEDNEEEDKGEENLGDEG